MPNANSIYKLVTCRNEHNVFIRTTV